MGVVVVQSENVMGDGFNRFAFGLGECVERQGAKEGLIGEEKRA